MGCCFSNDDDKNSQIGDINERTRLLGNPVSNNQARSSSDEHSRHHSLSAQKGDEQSALSRILHQTAASVIDVSTLDAHNLEQHEYMDRAKTYSQRINNTTIKGYQFSRPQCLLTDVPAVDRILAAEALSVADLQMIESVAEKVAKSVQEVRVDHKEELVVQFGIP